MLLPGHAAVRRKGHYLGIERLFGGIAFLMGGLILAGNAPVAVIAPLIGSTFLLCGVFCAFRLLPGGAVTGTALMGLGVVLLLPIFQLAAWALVPYAIVVGAILAAFGILKLT